MVYGFWLVCMFTNSVDWCCWFTLLYLITLVFVLVIALFLVLSIAIWLVCVVAYAAALFCGIICVCLSVSCFGDVC